MVSRHGARDSIQPTNAKRQQRPIVRWFKSSRPDCFNSAVVPYGTTALWAEQLPLLMHSESLLVTIERRRQFPSSLKR
jgi:hypothetical protein